MSKEMKSSNWASSGKDSLGKAIVRNISPRRVGLLFERGKDTLKEKGWQALWREVDFRLKLAVHGQTWRYRADIPLRRELEQQRQNPPKYAPVVSVVVPLYNTPKKYLAELIDSVKAQSYQNFELLLVDGGNDAKVKNISKAYASKDARIRYIPLDENKGIAGNTNAGLKAAKGQWICLCDHDDMLQQNALYEVVSAAEKTGAELIYSDEIVLCENMKKLEQYHFKGDFAPDTLRGCNYITHLCAFTKDLLMRAGGVQKEEYDGAQDYDLILRLSEKAKKIHHIPKVLYMWRKHAGSTASDISQKPKATEAGRKAVQAHVDRLGLKAAVKTQKDHPGTYRVQYAIKGTPKISILIPSCDHTDDLQRCLESIEKYGGWDNIEILVIDNNSKDEKTPLFYEKALKQYPKMKLLQYEGEFNYSDINNFAVKHASGEHLLLLNNDVELCSEGFLPEMLGYSQRDDVGAVGAMLYYPDDTVQHAGLIVGLGGTAGVSHKGHERGNGGDMYRLATTQNVSAVTGAALMVKTQLYKELGGLNAIDFGVAFNDVDFCLRLHEKGMWNVFTPYAVAYHFESKSRGYDIEGARKERFDREKAAFTKRWADMLQKGDPFYNHHFTLEYENFGLR